MAPDSPSTIIDSAEGRLHEGLTYEVFITAVTLLTLAMTVFYYLPGTTELVKLDFIQMAPRG